MEETRIAGTFECDMRERGSRRSCDCTGERRLAAAVVLSWVEDVKQAARARNSWALDLLADWPETEMGRFWCWAAGLDPEVISAYARRLCREVKEADPTPPFLVERAIQGKEPGIRKRAVLEEEPKTNERAVLSKNSGSKERAFRLEEPYLSERAVLGKEPEKKERATTLKEPGIGKRAGKKEKPEEQERAEEEKKPKKRERATLHQNSRVKKRAVKTKKPARAKHTIPTPPPLRESTTTPPPHRGRPGGGKTPPPLRGRLGGGKAPSRGRSGGGKRTWQDRWAEVEAHLRQMLGGRAWP